MTTFFCAKKFPQKSQVFLNLEVKRFHKKQKQLLWRLILVWGKAMTQKREKQKWKRRRRYDSPPTIIFTSTKILNGEEFTAASRNDTIEGESCAIHLVENSRSSIGAGESSKLLVQHKHFVLLWAPYRRGKICHCLSDVLNRNFGELKQSKHSNEA